MTSSELRASRVDFTVVRVETSFPQIYALTVATLSSINKPRAADSLIIPDIIVIITFTDMAIRLCKNTTAVFDP